MKRKTIIEKIGNEFLVSLVDLGLADPVLMTAKGRTEAEAVANLKDKWKRIVSTYSV